MTTKQTQTQTPRQTHNYISSERLLAAPPKQERVAEVLVAKELQEFKELNGFINIVRSSVSADPPYSFTGWYIFGKKDAIRAARERAISYRARVAKFRAAAWILLAIVKMQRSFRSRTWAYGGRLYLAISKSTLVGKN